MITIYPDYSELLSRFRSVDDFLKIDVDLVRDFKNRKTGRFEIDSNGFYIKKHFACGCGAVLDELNTLIERSVKKRAVGEFTIPGVMKITTVKKPAKKARKGINPFTGEATIFKAKPASIAVKFRPLKKLKEFAAS